ncbi:hypothetical protein N0V94_005570 [Neodidymelliopsis sp. IMI 364377]|nr:hypothetical protein N0V94_005570 [Neodidymelliopsis sp. IMI 364377]
MHNPSIVLYGAHNARLEDKEIPPLLDPHDVLVRIAYIGVCGSDVHFWNHGGIGKQVNPHTGITMGHEASGTIHSIGSAVTLVSPGDRVAIEPGTPCRFCPACKNGTYNLCRQMRFAAAPGPPDTQGTLTKYFRVAEDFVYRVPAEVIVDILENKVEFARGFLGVETFVADIGRTPEEDAERLLKEFGLEEEGIDTVGGKVDTVIEASGAASSINMGIHLLRPGGKYVQTGVGKPKIEFPIVALSNKELMFRGCFRLVDVKSMISSVTPFEDTIKAWEKTAKGEGVKNLIEGVKD